MKPYETGGPTPAPSFPGVVEPSFDFNATETQLRTLPRHYDVSLATARGVGELVIPIQGNTIYIDQLPTSGYATLYFHTGQKAGTPITVYPGMVLRFPFSGVMVTNVAQPGATLRIIYGTDLTFDTMPAAPLLGGVPTLNGEKSRVISQNCFCAAVFVAAVAAQSEHAQIYNPAASGKNVFVTRIGIGCAGATVNGSIQVFNSTLSSLMMTPRNKYIDGSGAAVAKIYTQNGAYINTAANHLRNAQAASGTTYSAIFDQPLCIPQGCGVIAANANQNILTCFDFEWFEEAA